VGSRQADLAALAWTVSSRWNRAAGGVATGRLPPTTSTSSGP